MWDTTESNTCPVADVRAALSENYPDSSYGTVPGLDQYDALGAYRVYDDGGLDENPQALAAHVDFHRCQWL